MPPKKKPVASTESEPEVTQPSPEPKPEQPKKTTGRTVEQIQEDKQKELAKRDTGKKPVVTQLFTEGPAGSRPVNIYIENVKGTHVIWYTTEDGKEVGREAVNKYDELRQQNFVVGFDYFVKATPQELEKILKNGFVKTKVYAKDGALRQEISPEEALKRRD